MNGTKNLHRKQKNEKLYIYPHVNTVNPVYSDHPRDPNIVAVVNRWSLIRGSLCYTHWNHNPNIVVVVNKWSLFIVGVVGSSLTVLNCELNVSEKIFFIQEKLPNVTILHFRWMNTCQEIMQNIGKIRPKILWALGAELGWWNER